GSVALESANTEIVAGGGGFEIITIDKPTEEAFAKRGIGVLAWIAIGWLVVITALAILAPVLPLKDPLVADLAAPKAGLFSTGHPLGTDATGFDVFSQAIWGAQASLLIAFGSVLFGTLIGGFLGLLAGFRGRNTDTVLSSVFGVLLAFPQLVLA